MKSVPASELRNLSLPELGQKRDAFAQELQQLRLKSKTIGVEKPAEFRRLRRGIARILTVVSEQRQPHTPPRSVAETTHREPKAQPRP